MDNKHRRNVFIVYCPSKERRQQAEQSAREGIDLGRDLPQTTRVFPSGVEKKTTIHHRLRDYFADIRIERQPEDDAAFKLVFDPREDADRYWKDLMVQILAAIRAEGLSVKALREKA